MSSFEWVELETLTSDIEAARSRLTEARKRNNQGAVGRLEVEITRAEKRRADLLAHISTSVASADPAPPPTARKGAGSRQAAAPAAQAVPVEEPPGDTASAPEPDPLPEAKDGANSPEVSAPAAEALLGDDDGERPSPDSVDRIVAGGAASSAAALKAGGIGGGNIMWNQLTPSDLDRAKTELGERRAEMLARHAEELKGLEADQSQLETLEQAIASFLQKFNSPESAVVKLDEERELRQQAGQQPS
jgi:hypothetical protein